MPSYRRRAGLLLAGMVVAVILALVAACLVYPPTYVWRVLVWQDADVGDTARFPARQLHASPQPRRLEPSGDGAEVRRAYAALNPGQDLDRMLHDTDTQAFLVLRRGELIYEGYFHGHARESLVTSFSVAKSFLGLLVGIAIEEGHLSGVDEPITRHLPELAARDARFGRITIGHLLHMASGIRYVERSFLHGDDAKTYYHPDMRALALQQTHIDGEPGQHFLYNNYHPLLLGLILERATGRSVTAYLQDKLWTPMGMAHDGSWSLDSEASGFEKLESGLNARAIDFAKLGLLMLETGERDGRALVPAAWVRASGAPLPGLDPASYYTLAPWSRLHPDVGYGYLWWTFRHDGDAPADFAARGNHGQFVFISPAHQVVVVRHAARYGLPPMQWMRLAQGLAQRLGAP